MTYHTHKFDRVQIEGSDPKGTCAQCDAKAYCKDETDLGNKIGRAFGQNPFYKLCKQDKPGDPIVILKLKGTHNGNIVT